MADLFRNAVRPIARPLHQLRQLGVDRNAPSFIARQQSSGSASAGFILIIDVADRLPVSIAHDEACAVVFKVPKKKSWPPAGARKKQKAPARI